MDNSLPYGGCGSEKGVDYTSGNPYCRANRGVGHAAMARSSDTANDWEVGSHPHDRASIGSLGQDSAKVRIETLLCAGCGKRGPPAESAGGFFTAQQAVNRSSINSA
jgi:hypothetical protein